MIRQLEDKTYRTSDEWLFCHNGAEVIVIVGPNQTIVTGDPKAVIVVADTLNEVLEEINRLSLHLNDVELASLSEMRA